MKRGVGATVLMVVLAGTMSPSASADTYIPTRFDDPIPGKCKPKDCSLREAIGAANALPERDTVQLKRGTYELSLTESMMVPTHLAGGLDIVNPVKLQGVSSKRTKIDANGVDRVLELGFPPYTSSGKSTIADVTLKGGDPGAAGASEGGGIYSNGLFLTLNKVVVRDNDAAFGGGIHHRGSFLTIKRSTIKGNNAGEGGGLHTPSTDGGPETDIEDSTISGNLANKGGGILADGAPMFGPIDPEVEVRNSTIALNETSAEGGGVMSDNGAAVILDNSTVAYNKADNDNAGGGVGGGIRQFNGALSVNDSIVAANTVGTSGSNPDCAVFTGINGEGNVSTAPAAECTGLAPGPNLFVGSALIGPLAANGGPTRTVKLNSGSPAIGFAADCPNKDQRGNPRPDDDCDAGAFERQGP